MCSLSPSLPFPFSLSFSVCMCMCVFFRTNDCSFVRKHSRTHTLNQCKTTGHAYIHHTLAKRIQGSLHRLLLFLLILLSETLKATAGYWSEESPCQHVLQISNSLEERGELDWALPLKHYTNEERWNSDSWAGLVESLRLHQIIMMVQITSWAFGPDDFVWTHQQILVL